MPAKIVPGRKALKSISGRNAGEDHARTQCPLRGETKDRVTKCGLGRSGYEERVLLEEGEEPVADLLGL